MPEHDIDVNTIKRVDNKAVRKVTTDTNLVCAFIPQGILHATTAILDLAPSLDDINKQLRLCSFSPMLQLINISGSPISTIE